MRVIALFLTMALAQPIALAQRPQAPEPFPKPGVQQPAKPAAPPETPPAQPPTTTATATDPHPTEATLGVPIYPGAAFIASYDAGLGQRFYLFGSTASFVSLVTYYRTILKQRGELVFEAPATHQFDVGRFREQTMAFPPSITIKDYESAVSRGYPNPRPGAQPEWFPTIIQVVPPSPGEQR